MSVLLKSLISVVQERNQIVDMNPKFEKSNSEENWLLLFTPVSITMLIDTVDARFILNGISPIAKGDLKWRDALLVTGTVNSNNWFENRIDTGKCC